MKTLIFNGSPISNGNTVAIIDKLSKDLNGDIKIVNAYNANISPCVDCRYCWENKGCCFNDDMHEIYDYIQNCDNIIIASPIYFSELTGKLLDVGSRLQTYYCARHFRNETPIHKPKNGAVILVGGGDGNMDKAYDTACTLLHHMNCYNIYPPVVYRKTNDKTAVEDKFFLKNMNEIIEFLWR